MSADRDHIEGLADDVARLIRAVSADLGYAANPAEVARRVRGRERGVPAEDEFGLICAWLGQRRLLHKLDQQHAHAN
jgi:hypothetical protein